MTTSSSELLYALYLCFKKEFNQVLNVIFNGTYEVNSDIQKKEDMVVARLMIAVGKCKRMLR